MPLGRLGKADEVARAVLFLASEEAAYIVGAEPARRRRPLAVSDVFLFPGQGAEVPGMGGDALARPGPVRDLLARASRTLGVELAAIIERGTPQLTAHRGEPACADRRSALGSRSRPSRVGSRRAPSRSLVGELSAFCLAGCLEPEEAIDAAVLARARFMAEAARAQPGGMAAVREPVEGVELAAHNAPHEWVVTGSKAELAALTVPSVPLPVAGPWHSRFMALAPPSSGAASLAKVRWQRPRIPLVANGTGWAVISDSDDLAELLIAQLMRPVRWAESLRTLVDLGATGWHFFGPARVLRGLCRANEIPSPRRGVVG